MSAAGNSEGRIAPGTVVALGWTGGKFRDADEGKVTSYIPAGSPSPFGGARRLGLYRVTVRERGRVHFRMYAADWLERHNPDAPRTPKVSR